MFRGTAAVQEKRKAEIKVTLRPLANLPRVSEARAVGIGISLVFNRTSPDM
jgi:hypothetical protein